MLLSQPIGKKQTAHRMTTLKKDQHAVGLQRSCLFELAPFTAAAPGERQAVCFGLTLSFIDLAVCNIRIGSYYYAYDENVEKLDIIIYIS